MQTHQHTLASQRNCSGKNNKRKLRKHTSMATKRKGEMKKWPLDVFLLQQFTQEAVLAVGNQLKTRIVGK